MGPKASLNVLQKGKIPSPGWIQTPDHPAHSLVTTDNNNVLNLALNNAYTYSQ